MAFAATNSSAQPVSFSIGPKKVQVLNWSAATGDTSGTVTCDGLSSAQQIILSGLTQTAVPTYSGNVVTITFADPVATVYGQLWVLGV